MGVPETLGVLAPFLVLIGLAIWEMRRPPIGVAAAPASRSGYRDPPRKADVDRSPAAADVETVAVAPVPSTPLQVLCAWELRMRELGYDQSVTIRVEYDGMTRKLGWLRSRNHAYHLFWADGPDEKYQHLTSANPDGPTDRARRNAIDALPLLYEACRKTMAERDDVMSQGLAHLATLASPAKKGG